MNIDDFLKRVFQKNCHFRSTNGMLIRQATVLACHDSIAYRDARCASLCLIGHPNIRYYSDSVTHFLLGCCRFSGRKRKQKHKS